jgi:rod shape determining protein RodA
VIVERRLSAHLDWPLIAAVLALTCLGLATIYSVTWNFKALTPGREFWTQVYAVPLALAALGVCVVIDYRTLAQRSPLIYAAVVLALLYVAFFGDVHGGARRWIPIFGVNLQPSEFGRIALALVLAMYFGDSRRGARSLPELLTAAALLGVLFFLIKREPDLGTSLTLVPVLLGAVYLAGIRMKWLVVGVVVAALLSPVVWFYGMQDYQRKRVETSLDPWKDPRGDGYQQIQAKVTVGSGGLVGKGFKSSTQGGLGFLPAAHNDFVFSVFAEEHGFLGILVALGLYLFVVLRSLDAARLARDRLGALLVVAIVSGFTFQVLYNITMSAGLAPVKGLTLPLMSYGGSSLVATFAGFGLILNVRMRRFTN